MSCGCSPYPHRVGCPDALKSDDVDTRPIRKPVVPTMLDWAQERERRHLSRRIERYVRHTEKLMHGSIDLGLYY